MNKTKILSLILAMIMVFQFIPSEIFAAPGNIELTTIMRMEGMGEDVTSVKSYPKNKNPRITFQKTFKGGYTIESAVLTTGGKKVFGSLDKSSGSFTIPLSQMYKPNLVFPKPAGDKFQLLLTYKMDPIKISAPAVTANKKIPAKPTKAVVVNTVKDVKAQPVKTTEESIKEVADYVGVATKNMQGLAITLYEYYSTSGALPNIGVAEYEKRVKGLTKVTNDTEIFTPKEVSDFYLSQSEEVKNTTRSLTLSAIDSSFKSEYTGFHPALDYDYETATDNYRSMFEGKVFQQLPFIHAFNTLRTAIVFTKDPVGKEVLGLRNMGNTIDDKAAFNPLFAPDSLAAGDYSTRRFHKNPISRADFAALLQRRGLKTANYSTWKTLGQSLFTEEEQLVIIDSAIKGISMMIDEAGFRPWDGKKTFNYLRPAGWSADTADIMTPEKIQGWKDSLVIIQFPSKYTWGSGLLYNQTGFYAEVPLAPTIGNIDVELKEVSTEWSTEDNAYLTVFEYKTDLMPSIPETLDEFRPSITFGVVDGVVVSNTLVNIKGEVPEVTTLGLLEEETKTNHFAVLWRPNSNLAPDKNALLYASVNVMDQIMLDKLTGMFAGTPGPTLDHLNKIKSSGEVNILKNVSPAFNRAFYKGPFEEVDYSKNVAKVLKPLPPLDLYLDKVTSEYEKTTGLFTVKGNVGFTSAGRSLELAKGELPVELIFTWKTQDGQSGSNRVDYNTFDAGTEQPFVFTDTVNMPLDGELVGEYTVRVNPDPINPHEPDVKNNEVTSKFGDAKFIDFVIDPLTTYIPVVKGDKPSTDLNFVATLFNTQETISSNVILYKNGIQVATQNFNFVGGNPQVVKFTIPDGNFTLGNNNYAALVNSNFALSTATPFVTEKDLTNNKALTVVEYSNNIAPPPGSCEFKVRSGDDVKYDVKDPASPFHFECVSWNKWGCTGSVKVMDWEPLEQTYNFKRESKVVYSNPQSNNQNGLFSNDWHRDSVGQKYGKDNLLPTGKILTGGPATNELMSAIGYNPLRQVIQAGAGIQVRTKIKVTGYVEALTSAAAKAHINDYIDDLKTNASYVSGRDVPGATNSRNNKGEYTQKMEYDTNRSGEYKLEFNPTGTDDLFKLGDPLFGPESEVNYVTFEADIPMIITVATGTIDVLGGKKAPVPAERKWFVYMNELNNPSYGLKIGTVMKPSVMGGIGGNIDCILTHSDFKFGIFGTIFDNINVSDPGDGGGGIWDN